VHELSFVRSQISATGLHSLLDLLAGRPVLGSFFHMYRFFLACSLSAVPPGPVPKRLPCPFSFFFGCSHAGAARWFCHPGFVRHF
jgi:hypothetical protein